MDEEFKAQESSMALKDAQKVSDRIGPKAKQAGSRADILDSDPNFAVLVFCGRYDKSSQPGWPKITKITEASFLTLVENRSLKSRCWQGQCPCEGSAGEG